jgi:DNA-binding Lrp family transcriptional regulator
MKAYIFINTSAGSAIAVADKVRSIPGMISADAITGQYDVVATCDVDDLRSIGQLIVMQIQAQKGVLSTRTSLVIRP